METYNEKFWQFYRTKKGLYTISALLPMLVMLFVWVFMGVFPFGTKTLMSIDFGQQYISLYQFFKKTVLSGDWSGLFYSFSKSIGGGMIGIWGFNLISPFNLIYVLFPTAEFRWAITLTIWLRYGATALAFSHLLIKRYNGHLNNRRFLVPILSAAYAMCGLIVSYQMNPIFYDAMIMLPIVIIYLEELLDGGRGWKYAVLLSLTLMFHFYMGYMICLFIVLYTLYYLTGKDISWKNAIRPIIRVAAYSVVAAGAMMWLLYPIFLNLLISKGAYQNNLDFDWNFQIRPLDILAKFMIGAFDSESWPAGPNLPNVFIGSLALFGFGAFFANKSISRKQKWAAALVMFVFFIAIVNEFFNKVWHMSQTPAGFFYRFSWIISFFMVLLSYRALHNWQGKSWRFVSLGAAFIYLSAEWVFRNEFSFFNYRQTNEIMLVLENYLGLAFRLLIILFAFSALQYKGNKEKRKRYIIIGSSVLVFLLISILSYFKVLVTLQTLSLVTWCVTLIVLSFGLKRVTWAMISALTIFELGFNAYVSQSRMGYDNANHFKDAQVSVKPVIDQIRPSKQGEFYRINKLFERSKNDPFMYDYPGLTHFSSNMERSTLSFMTNMGDSGSNASSFYGNGTAFMDAFYGVKYVVDFLNYTNDDMLKYPERRFFSRNTTRTDLTDYYTKIWENDRYAIYENPNVLPIAFGVNAEVTDLTFYANQIVKTYNELFSALSGQTEDIFKSEPLADATLTNVELVQNGNSKIYRKIDKTQNGTIEFKIIPKNNDTHYLNAPLSLKRKKGGAIDIRLNGRWYEYQHSFDGQQLWNIAHKQQGEEIIFSITLGTSEEVDLTDLYLITANQQLTEPLIQKRAAQGMKVSEWGNNFVKGNVNITDNSTYMMTSIPYNLGWHVLVDGQEVAIKETWGAFLSFPITSGQHTIEMRFKPDGWTVGLLLSGVSIVLLLALHLIEERYRRGV
ncbi:MULTISPECIES: YfhO family protein [unclassified Facklamia]|uniref:YfhO family protein n=1 Tax=Aerococcaceae TaxID=186827 RepID=UPI0013B96F7F|nr:MULTISPECIES: YfhO family protein [unclassified Facklamia]NEW63640.1 YfhO family protein [Facklamia sp. 252]NEW67111.1 YfhO family protein [Facklamia sp. 253]QQD66344.1 YfhO family protein [Aerococcaceae bacterium zg-252]